ncbi:hypothetical protein C8J57DRAFT_1387875 [Mycena rebaudengoi]|nr:hypothetical protein C8J57DRAFT_1387875 [Mycena rebaudengoi]
MASTTPPPAPLVAVTGSTSPSPLTIGLVLLLALWPLVSAYRARPQRSARLPPANERVLILGASSGIGRALAMDYANLGVRGVCVVGRRADAVKAVVSDCEALAGNAKGKKNKKGRKGNADGEKGTDILGVPGDFADVESMVALRKMLADRWGGIDTVIVAAGVSALRPLMEVAGVEPSKDNKAAVPDATVEGIQRAVDVASLATRGNYVGPLVAAITFIPLLTNTSPAPAILLVNSLASVIPAPTRTLYASTKAASLLLYQALAIEHPRIAFTLFMPSTVEGDFRLGAVDGGSPREADPNVHGLKRGDVSKRCRDAVERGEKNVFMPWSMGPAHIVYWLWPTFVEGKARVKYNFP